MQTMHANASFANGQNVPSDSQTVNSDDGFLPARYVLNRYRVSQMMLWRWLHGDEVGFPQYLYLGRYRYWRIVDMEAWEAAQAAKREAAR